MYHLLLVSQLNQQLVEGLILVIELNQHQTLTIAQHQTLTIAQHQLIEIAQHHEGPHQHEQLIEVHQVGSGHPQQEEDNHQ